MSTDAPALSFDAIAAAYDRSRPDYPTAIFDKILAYAQCQQASAEILEIGTGTGKATRPFAVFGHRMHCLEPGPKLVEFARRQVADLGNVTVEQISFEEWEPGRRQFDIAFSAQAFHWLDPARRLDKLAKVIRTGGVLAVFGHSSTLAPSQLAAAVQTAYAAHAPAIAQRDNARHWYTSRESPVWRELNEHPLFGDLEFHVVDWARELSSEAYRELVATYSDHATLPTEQRRRLLDAIALAIRQNGGVVRVEYTTGLFLARAHGQEGI